MAGQIARTYNDRGWLTGIGDLGAPTGFAAGYAYYSDGNVKADTSHPEGSYSQFVRSYDYDALGRLTSADYGADGLGKIYDVQDLTYDPNGNLQALTRYAKDRDTGNPVLVDDLTYDYDQSPSPNQLDEITDGAGDNEPWDAGSGSFEYDAAGRMLQAPAPTALRAAAYDAQGLPEAMALGGAEGETTLTYRYTASGQRTYKKAEGSEATRDGSATLAVVTGGSLKHWTLTLPGGEVIGRVGSGGSSRRYYLKDHLGSIRAVLDGGGGVRETRDYYPFGLPMPGRHEKGSPPTREDYTGHVKDEATGLHYAGARYYSAAFGRWTTPDPILGRKGPKVLLGRDRRLLTMTSYNYAFDNPLRLTDPTGLAPTD